MSYQGISLRGLVDQLDSVNFPRAGYAASFEIHSSLTALGSDAAFTRGETTGTFVKSFGEHTFSGSMKFGGRLGGDRLPGSELFQWGGLLQQSGYPTGALLGEELMFGRIVYTRRLARSTLVDGVYAGLSLEVGRMRRPLIPNNEQGVLQSAALLLGVDTPVGPLYLGYGHANHGFAPRIRRPNGDETAAAIVAQRQLVDDADGACAETLRQLALERRVERHQVIDGRILRRWKRDACSEDAIRLESRIDRERRQQTAAQQRHRHEQHERE